MLLEQIEQLKIKGIAEGERRRACRLVQGDNEMCPTKRQGKPPRLDFAWHDLGQIWELAKRGQRLRHLSGGQVQRGGQRIELRRGGLSEQGLLGRLEVQLGSKIGHKTQKITRVQAMRMASCLDMGRLAWLSHRLPPGGRDRLLAPRVTAGGAGR